MKFIFFRSILIMAFVVCKINLCESQIMRVSGVSLISGIEKYRDTKVEIEGYIVHICGVDGKKMKLMTDSGEIIKIIPKDSLGSFDESFYKKRVKVQGIVKESRIEKSEIDKIEKDVALLCHIDHTPCKDSAWVNNQIKKGTAENMSQQDIEKLREKMRQTGKDYISVITIVAEKVEVIEEIKN